MYFCLYSIVEMLFSTIMNSNILVKEFGFSDLGFVSENSMWWFIM